MTVLRESPWYQEILQEGRKDGIQEGRQEGRQEGERLLILRQLSQRVGSLSSETRSQIQSLPLDQLESLGEALLDFSQPSDLTDWLRSQGM